MALENVDNRFEQPVGGSTDNKFVMGGSVESGGGQSLKKMYITAEIADVSTAGSTWVVPGVAGTITKISTVLHAAITAADADITAEIGGTLVTGSLITIATAGSAAGDVDSATPTALNVVTAADAIEIITDGGSTTTAKVTVTIEVALT